jgi:hypothetical protein
LSHEEIASFIRKEYSEELRDTILDMLKEDHNARPTALELKNRVKDWLPKDYNSAAAMA